MPNTEVRHRRGLWHRVGARPAGGCDDRRGSRHGRASLRQRRDRREAARSRVYAWSRTGRCRTPTTTSRSSSTPFPPCSSRAASTPPTVIGIGIDFTACTILPTKADGTPLCFLPEYRNRPHAWVKLWKHHAAQPEANKLNATARRWATTFSTATAARSAPNGLCPRSCRSWTRIPAIYDAADRLIEAADWVIWQLTGIETRNLTTAGYKGHVVQARRLPAQGLLQGARSTPGKPGRREDVARHPRTGPEGRRADRAGGSVDGPQARHGGGHRQCRRARRGAGCHRRRAGAHGHHHGHLQLPHGDEPRRAHRARHVRLCGGRHHPGLFGYEAGQSCVGDHFAWFTENCVPAAYEAEATQRGISIHQLLEEKAAALSPARAGCWRWTGGTATAACWWTWT